MMTAPTIRVMAFPDDRSPPLLVAPLSVDDSGDPAAFGGNPPAVTPFVRVPGEVAVRAGLSLAADDRTAADEKRVRRRHNARDFARKILILGRAFALVILLPDDRRARSDSVGSQRRG